MQSPILLQGVWRRRLGRSAIGLVVAAILLWSLALFLTPVLKQQIESRGSAEIGRTLTLGSLELHPWSLGLTLTDIDIAHADGRPAQMHISRLEVSMGWESVWRLAPVVDAVRIDQPRVELVRQSPGHYDIDDLLQRFQSEPAQTEPSKPVRFAIYNVELKDGAADFTDQAQSPARSHTLRRLNFGIPFLSNMDSSRDVLVQPRLAFELNGSSFDTGVQAKPFATDRVAEASLRITHLDVAPYLTYLPASLPVRMQSAVLDTELTLQFEQLPAPRFRISGKLGVSQLRLAERNGANLFQMDSLNAVLRDVEPLRQQVHLDSLVLAQPQLQLSRDQDGRLNIASLQSSPAPKAQSATNLQPADKPQPSTKAQPPVHPAEDTANPWKFSVASFTLQDGQVQWRDASVVPAAALVTHASLTLKNLAWPTAPANPTATASTINRAELDGDVTLTPMDPKMRPSLATKSANANAGTTATVHIHGSGSEVAGNVRLNLTNLGLPLAAPYVANYLMPTVKGTLEGELAADWQGEHIKAQLPRLQLRDFALVAEGQDGQNHQKSQKSQNSQNRPNAGSMPAFKLLEMQDGVVDLTTRQVRLGKLTLAGFQGAVQRDADGQLQFSHWLKSPSLSKQDPSGHESSSGTTEQAASPSAAPWKLTLADVQIKDANVTLADLTPVKPVLLLLSNLQFQANNLSLDGKVAAPLHLRANVGNLADRRTEPGQLKFDGTAMWAPLRVQGTLDARQLPVHVAAPYLMQSMRLELLRADASFKGQLQYADVGGAMNLDVRGDAAIDDVKVNSLAADGTGATLANSSENLLNWTSLSIPGIVFSMHGAEPPQLQLGDVALSDFFVRLIVNPQGRLVLQDLVIPKDAGAATVAPGLPPATTATTTAATAATTATPASAPTTAALAPEPVIDVASIRVVNGQVAFSDRFIKPNYSAELSELNGSLGRFSTRRSDGSVQIAALQLHGRAQGTASLDIEGQINPLVHPLDLDIQAHVRDLELSPLSSYAIKYAGYGIERGKLSVDLNYRIQPDSTLVATNHIVLNQLTFGEPVPDAKASLPVKLATALLADRNGVINLNLPVSGSLNDPQFSIWPVVWKILGNLVTKALTAPFSLFSGGDSTDVGADLSSVAFDAGTSRISAAGQQTLQRLAQALLDRPSLLLTITGAASREVEETAIRRDRLNELLLAEKRRAAGINGTDVRNVGEVTPEQYPSLVKAVYQRSDIKKPRNLIGIARDLPLQQMETLLLDSVPVNPDTLRALALQRAVAVREFLSAQKLSSDRLFLNEEKIVTGDALWTPRAELNISRP